MDNITKSILNTCTQNNDGIGKINPLRNYGIDIANELKGGISRPIMYDDEITLEKAASNGIKLKPHILFGALGSNKNYTEYESGVFRD